MKRSNGREWLSFDIPNRQYSTVKFVSDIQQHLSELYDITFAGAFTSRFKYFAHLPFAIHKQ